MNQKHIVLVVSGGIAAYKACDLASRLSKTGHEIRVVLTHHAEKFVPALTFESLTGNPVLTTLFETHPEDAIAHVNLAKWADVIAVVPATANLLAKAANGIADDLASTLLLAGASKPRLACPAMNVHMYEAAPTQRNIATLRSDGWEILEPVSGLLACKDTGKGKLPPVEDIEEKILSMLSDKPLTGKRVLITAGPTQEALDPVRYISNHSTGKQGYAMARAARDLGADVTLVSGPVSIPAPAGVDLVPVVSAADMFSAVKAHPADWYILSAAVADFRPKRVSDQKLKKDQGMDSILLEPNPDILAWLGENKQPGQVLCGFCMETRDLEAQARKKLEKKHCDLLVANNLFDEGAGFGTDTNRVLLLDREDTASLPLQSKYDLAKTVLMRMKEIDDAGSH